MPGLSLEKKIGCPSASNPTALTILSLSGDSREYDLFDKGQGALVAVGTLRIRGVPIPAWRERRPLLSKE